MSRSACTCDEDLKDAVATVTDLLDYRDCDPQYLEEKIKMWNASEHRLISDVKITSLGRIMGSALAAISKAGQGSHPR
eukprot:7200803-Pyramimonas_sp.AAC.1